MVKRYSLLLGIILSFCLQVRPAFAEQSAPKPVLKIGVSMFIPPWVIKDDDSGIELDLLRMAFEETPYDIEIIYGPFAHIHGLFDTGELDGYINAKHNPDKGGYLSETVATFQNVAVSLVSKQYPEDITVEFLADKQVVAFQKASQLLGPAFYEMALKNPSYQEVGKQSLQINLLFARNVDFIVLDKSIFGYYWKQAADRKDEMAAQYNYFKPVTFHEMFAPSHYSYRFQTEAVRDLFDQGLRKLKANGRYEEVFKKYDHLARLYEGRE